MSGYERDREEYRGHTIRIVQDEDPINPRQECDNFGTMVCWHHAYSLGDEQRSDDPADFFRELAIEADPHVADVIDYWENAGYEAYGEEKSDAMVKKAIERAIDKHVVMLELYLYDHGGITISCSPFSCPWDSGQVGYIYVTRADILKEYGGKVLTQAKRKQAEALLRCEVEVYDQYLTGDVWGYIVEHEPTGWEESCWGFFGDDYCMQEAKSIVDRHVEDMRKKRIEQVKVWIRNKVPLAVRMAATL